MLQLSRSGEWRARLTYADSIMKPLIAVPSNEWKIALAVMVLGRLDLSLGIAHMDHQWQSELMSDLQLSVKAAA